MAQETDLERISRLIAEVEEQQFLLLGLDPEPAVTPAMETTLAELSEEKHRLEEELADVWAKHCSKC